MAIFSGEVTIKVRFKDIQVAVGYGMTSAIIKHRCVQQAYAKSPWSKIKNQKDDRFEVIIEKENIEARPLWKPMHLQPVFKSFPAYLNGVSEQLFSQGLCLPSDTNMIENEFKRVEEVISNLLKN